MPNTLIDTTWSAKQGRGGLWKVPPEVPGPASPADPRACALGDGVPSALTETALGERADLVP